MVKGGGLSTRRANVVFCTVVLEAECWQITVTDRIRPAAVFWCLGALHSSNGLTNGTVAQQKLRSPFGLLPPYDILPAPGRAGGTGYTLSEVEVYRTA
jgi:hypothetical protein